MSDFDTLRPGDFLLCHGTSRLDRLIQFATRSHWNHVALAVGGGWLVEAQSQGIVCRHVDEYAGTDYHVIPPPLTAAQRNKVCAYAHHMADAHDRYGYVQIAAIVLQILTRGRLVLKLDGTLICSEFVSRALEHGGIIFDRDPALISPAYLAQVFDVTPRLEH